MIAQFVSILESHPKVVTVTADFTRGCLNQVGSGSSSLLNDFPRDLSCEGCSQKLLTFLGALSQFQNTSTLSYSWHRMHGLPASTLREPTAVREQPLIQRLEHLLGLRK